MQKNAPYQSLPQFEQWIKKAPSSHTSMYNSKIKKTRKMNRSASLSNEQEFKAHILKGKKTEQRKISKVRFLPTFVNFLIFFYGWIVIPNFVLATILKIKLLDDAKIIVHAKKMYR